MSTIKHNNTIKAELKKNGITQLDIAEMLKVNPVCVHDVISGKRKNPRIRKAIALAIGMPVDQIDWPEQNKNAPGPAIRCARYGG